MKNLKILIILIITISLVIVGTYKIVEAVSGYDTKYQVPVGEAQISFPDEIWENDNIYCVEYDQTMNDGVDYNMLWSGNVTIDGDKATFGDGTVVVSETNNMLAAILCPSDLGRGSRWAGTGYGYTWSFFVSTDNGVPSKDYRKARSDAQEGLYYYWNIWYNSMVDENGVNVAYENGFRSDPKGWYGDEDHEYEGTWGINRINELKLLEKYDFQIKIYYLENQNGSSYQNLIAVYPEQPAEKDTKISVQKVWQDNDNKYNIRPSSITVELLANGVSTGKTLKLDASNNWEGEFTDLDSKNGSGETITYTIKELNCNGYATIITGTAEKGFTITNKLLTEVTAKKEWDDMENIDNLRPDSIAVTLYANDITTGKSENLNEENNWTYTFEELNKFDTQGNVIKYSVKEDAIEGYTTTYVSNEDASTGYTIINIKNTHEPEPQESIELTGKVWEDEPEGKASAINGILDEDESGLTEIKVTLKNSDGTDFEINGIKYQTTTAEDGTYKFIINYKNSQNVKTKLSTAYVEFEYDGLKYTTVKPNVSEDKEGNAVPSSQQSKAIERYSGDGKTRENLDKTYSNITSKSKILVELTDEDKAVVATTQNVMSFESYQTVNAINNINLGLFKREQPDISIEENLYQVDVNVDRDIKTFKYNAVDMNKTNDGLQVQFQNKKTYTYRRPVNPTYVQQLENVNEENVAIYVTYKVKITNNSSTLVTKVDSIINCYDNRYEFESASIDGKSILDKSESNIYRQPKEDFSEITLSALNIILKPYKSQEIELKYKVMNNAKNALLNEKATLNNAVEIESYSTFYGEGTLYAEKQKGERNNLQYAGYDKDSNPGNAGIKLNVEDYTYTYTDNNGNKQTKTYEKVNVLKQDESRIITEDDIDIAPSFLIHM